MNNKLNLIRVLLAACFFVSACVKSDKIQPVSKAADIDKAAKIQINPYTIINLAGSSFPSNLVDGPGNLARFYNPKGIQVKPGGILYVADYQNNAIRKIVVKPLNGDRNQFSATVSTLNTPAGLNGLKLSLPLRVGVSDDGTINTLFGLNGVQVFGRIYKPSGTIYTVQIESYGYAGMSQDLSGSFYWFTGNLALGKFWSDHIQLPNFDIPRDSLNVYYGHHYLYSNPSLNNVYVAANGDLYVSTIYQFFKISKTGVINKIAPIAEYPDLPIKNVTDMAVSDDGKTIYFTEDWKIRKLENGKVTTLVYPSGIFESEGIPANIYASGIGIDDKQHILYFTDQGSVKILTLPGYVAH